MYSSLLMLLAVLTQFAFLEAKWGFGTSYMSTDPDDVEFYLYPNAADNSDYDQLFYKNESSIQNSRFNKSNPVIFLTHGFTQNYTSLFPTNVKNAYLEAGFASKANIIAVNWGNLSGEIDTKKLPSTLSAFPSYIRASKNVKIVGKRLAEFLVFLMELEYIRNSSDIHLIGHSLGAHVSGLAGSFFLNMTSTLVGRITGSDPAAPLFQWISKTERLNQDDAQFVDIIHTDQAVLGYVGGLGHVDFYVDLGGPIQPICLTEFAVVSCSHNAAPKFYAKSILNPNIKACGRPKVFGKCPSSDKVIFGENCPSNARGYYFLEQRDFK